MSWAVQEQGASEQMQRLLGGWVQGGGRQQQGACAPRAWAACTPVCKAQPCSSSAS